MYRLLLVAVVLLTEVLLARFLGPAGRGYVAIFTITPVLIAVVAGCGLDYSLNFFGHRDEATIGMSYRRALWAGLGVSLVLGGLLAVDPGGVLNWLYHGVPPGFGAAKYLSLGIVPTEVFFALSAMLAMTLGHPVLYGKIRVLRRAGVLVAVVASALVFRGRLMPAVTLVVASQIAAVGIAGAVPLWLLGPSASGSRRLRDRVAGPGLSALLRYGFQSLPARLAERLQARVDIVLLGLLSAGSVVGVYAVAAGIAETLYYVSGSLSAVLFTRSAERDSKLHLLTLRIMLPFGIVAALLLGTLALVLVPLAFGKAFGGAVRLLWILLPGTVAFSAVQIASPYFVQRGMSGVVSVANGLGVVGNVALNLLLIPRYAATGAAVSSAVSYTLTGAWMLHRLTQVEDGSAARLLVVDSSELGRLWLALKREARALRRST